MNPSRFIVGAVILYSITFTPFVFSGGDNLDAARSGSEDYVIVLDGCAFLDGYECGDQSNDDYLSAASQEKMLSGNLLKAWLVALNNFQSQTDQTDDQTDLKHYKFGFSESADHYIVLFQGLLMPRVENGQISEVSEITTVTLGRTTRYWINKKNFEIDKRLFYK